MYDILFSSEAWKEGDSLTQDLASTYHMAISHARMHGTHHCRIHNPGPERENGS